MSSMLIISVSGSVTSGSVSFCVMFVKLSGWSTAVGCLSNTCFAM